MDAHAWIQHSKISLQVTEEPMDGILLKIYKRKLQPEEFKDMLPTTDRKKILA